VVLAVDSTQAILNSFDLKSGASRNHDRHRQKMTSAAATKIAVAVAYVICE